MAGFGLLGLREFGGGELHRFLVALLVQGAAGVADFLLDAGELARSFIAVAMFVDGLHELAKFIELKRILVLGPDDVFVESFDELFELLLGLGDADLRIERSHFRSADGGRWRQHC